MASMSALIDGFASSDSGKWNNYNGTTITTSGGLLQITPDNTFGAAISAVTSYDLTGNHAVIEVTALGSSQILSLAVVDGTNRFEMFYNFGDLMFRETVAGVTDDANTITYNGTAHRWWRIREVAGTVYWDTSPNGADWLTRRSKTWAIPAVTALTPFLMAYTASGSTVATMDNFNQPRSGAFF